MYNKTKEELVSMSLPVQSKKPIAKIFNRNILIYGAPKTGKTTMASVIPNSLFLATEKGHDFIEADVLPVKDWATFKKYTNEILTKEEYFKKYKTIIVDTVDNLHLFCRQHITRSRGIEHEQDEGFGKAYDIVKREFTNTLNYLTNAGLSIVFISHDKIIEKDERGKKVTYISTSLNDKTDRLVSSMCDYIFYLYTNSEGERLVRTKGDELINAGDRSGKLPPVMKSSPDFLVKVDEFLKGEKK